MNFERLDVLRWAYEEKLDRGQFGALVWIMQDIEVVSRSKLGANCVELLSELKRGREAVSAGGKLYSELESVQERGQRRRGRAGTSRT